MDLPVTFTEPVRLLVLVVVGALALLYVRLLRRPSPHAVRFPELDLLAAVAPRVPGWRRHVPAGLLLLALVALTTGFARPEAERRVPRERATVVVALDVSLSMEADDVDPDRITEAKRAARVFVDGLPGRFNVGLVAFSGVASVVVPPTQDHASVLAAVDGLELGPGTAIGEAVITSLQALAQVPGQAGAPAPPARVVLLSDGANTQGRPISRAVEQATAAGVPVSTIAYGTEEGVVEVEGQRVPVPVDAPALRRLAEQTGGEAYEAESGDELSQVYDDIGSQVGSTVERQEVTVVLTGLGLALAAAAAVTALLWSPRVA
ncbi:MAG: VWA domain-containing protein [Actinomycetota bacterium]|nr:VWA domain-containing protein [Actinomycetota bacterium]